MLCDSNYQIYTRMLGAVVLCFLVGCFEKRLNWVSLVVLSFIVWFFGIFLGSCSLVPQSNDLLERLVSKMTYYVSSGTLTLLILPLR